MITQAVGQNFEVDWYCSVPMLVAIVTNKYNYKIVQEGLDMS